MSSRGSRTSVFNGKRISPLTKPVMGRGKGNEIIDCLNGLLTVDVQKTDSAKGEFKISNNRSTLLLPKGASSGGGTDPASNSSRMRVKGVYSTYLVCRTWDGATEGASDVYVAKPPHLRWYASSWPSMSVEGTTLTITHSARTGNIDGMRTVSGSAPEDQIEVVVPVWQYAAVGSGIGGGLDEIWAVTCSTGVVTGTETNNAAPARPAASAGVTLTMMDDNRNARSWMQIDWV